MTSRREATSPELNYELGKAMNMSQSVTEIIKKDRLDIIPDIRTK